MGIYQPKNKDGSLCKYWWISFRYQGRLIRESTKSTSKQYAQKALEIRKAEVTQGRYRIVPKKGRISFPEFAEKFLDWSRLNKKTFRNDEYRIKFLKKFFGTRQISSITPQEIEQYKDKRLKGKLGKPVKGATVNREVQLLRRMFNLAITWGYVSENPTTKIKYFPEPPKTHRWVRPEEVDLVLAHCKGKCRHLKPIILVALYTGLRKSELLNLKWEQVDLENKQIIVKHAKHYRNRYIPLNDDVLRILADEIPKRGDYVFTKSDRSPYTRVDKSLATVVKKAGITKCTLHDFRATWATELLAGGADMESVRQLGGWRDYTTILRYLEAIPARQQHAVDLLNGKYCSRFVHVSQKSRKDVSVSP